MSAPLLRLPDAHACTLRFTGHVARSQQAFLAEPGTHVESRGAVRPGEFHFALPPNKGMLCSMTHTLWHAPGCPAQASEVPLSWVGVFCFACAPRRAAAHRPPRRRTRHGLISVGRWRACTPPPGDARPGGTARQPKTVSEHARAQTENSLRCVVFAPHTLSPPPQRPLADAVSSSHTPHAPSASSDGMARRRGAAKCAAARQQK